MNLSIAALLALHPSLSASSSDLDVLVLSMLTDDLILEGVRGSKVSVFTASDAVEGIPSPIISSAESGSIELLPFAESGRDAEHVVLASSATIIGALLSQKDLDPANTALILIVSGLSDRLLKIMRDLPEGICLVSVVMAAERNAIDAAKDILKREFPDWVLEQGEVADPPKAVFSLSRSSHAKKGARAVAKEIAACSAAGDFSSFRIVSATLDEDQVLGTVTGPADGAEPTPQVVAFSEGAPVSIAPLAVGENGQLNFRLQIPRHVVFGAGVRALQINLGAANVDREAVDISLPDRRLLSAERLLASDRSDLAPPFGRKPLGIILYSHTRTEEANLILESLHRQGALDLVEIWMDGDQGNPEIKKTLDLAEASFRNLDIARVVRHRGNLGFRKLIIQSLMYMTNAYDRFIVLEDDCFPNRFAVDEFVLALDNHRDDQEVLTVYGHHFNLPAERPTFPRFQSWGWATYSDRIKPFVKELAFLYSLPEADYLEWVKSVVTPEIKAKIDCTPPRNPSATLQRFFAWDETLTLISAIAGCVHAPTTKRCVYNFGAGEESTHFGNIDWYRKPPFNMIPKSEVWEYF